MAGTFGGDGEGGFTYFVVGKLLPEANSRPSVKREEDERVWSEVLREPVVEETIWVEFLC